MVVSRPVLDTKTLPWCQRVEVVEERLQTSYKCENPTRQHCTSLWKIVNGEKVWAGNDECRGGESRLLVLSFECLCLM